MDLARFHTTFQRPTEFWTQKQCKPQQELASSLSGGHATRRGQETSMMGVSNMLGLAGSSFLRA